MNFNFKETKLNKTQGEYTCSTSGDDWKKYMDAAEKELSQKIQVPGFRKGHVPLAVAKKHLSTEQVGREAAHEFVDDAYNFVMKKTDKKINFFMQEDIELKVESMSVKGVVLKFIFSLLPEVDAKNWKELKVTLKNKSVSEKDIENQKNVLLNQHSSFEVIEDESHELKNGEIAVIDFSGSLDGVKFQGGEAKKFPLTIGNQQFIPGFEEKLIGMIINTSKIIKVTFPKDYHEKSLANKEVQFDVFLHEIKQKNSPVFNDEFIKGLKIENINSVEEWTKLKKEELAVTHQNSAMEEAEEKVLELLTKKITCEIADSIIQKETMGMFNNFLNRIKEAKLNKDLVLEELKKTEEELKDQFKDDAKNRLCLNFVLNAIADVEKVYPTEKNYDEWVEKTAKTENMTVEELKQKLPISQEIMARLRNEMIWEVIKKELIISK